MQDHLRIRRARYLDPDPEDVIARSEIREVESGRGRCGGRGGYRRIAGIVVDGEVDRGIGWRGRKSGYAQRKRLSRGG